MLTAYRVIQACLLSSHCQTIPVIFESYSCVYSGGSFFVNRFKDVWVGPIILSHRHD